MIRSALLSLLALPAFAQQSVPFPAVVTSSPQDGVLILEQDHALLDALHAIQSKVILQGVPLPHGHVVDLELARIDFDLSRVGVHADGRRRAHEFGNLSLWKGGLPGVDGSHAFLALSSRGSYGWVHDGVDVTHVSALPSDEHGWAQAQMRVYTNAALMAAGRDQGPRCLLDQMTNGPTHPLNWSGGNTSNQSGGQPLECKMAVETDHQLYQLWNNLDAEVNYVMALCGALSDRFFEQLQVRITFPYVQFYTSSADPWSTQDSGGSSGDLLGEFQAAWAGNQPAGAHLCHFLSGAGLGGGVAWVDVLCNTTYGFAVSGNINGGVTFPVSQGGNTWDFFVFAHESGHNFGSPHTHDYCPPLDECADNCNGVINCTTTGTNMSYCHGCTGGMNNITTYFHPTAVALMRARSEAACLPDLGSGTPVVIFSDDFESGDLATGGWITSNQPSQALASAAKNGTYGCRIRRKRWVERTLDTSGFTNVSIELWRKTKNYDAGERLRIRVHDGSQWHTLEDATAPGWGQLQFELGAWANNNPSLRLRIRSGGNEGKERGDIDDVVVRGEQ